MSKTEILRQSAAASNETRLEHLASQIEAVRQAKHQSAEDLAATLEPLAQALAALADETRQTLIEIDHKTAQAANYFEEKISDTTQAWKDAAKAADDAAVALTKAATRMEWRHYALAVATGLSTAVLVSGFWLWLEPPTVKTELDAEAVANLLKPSMIEALRPSKNK
jgi:uncharacterized phage infection (PIP) family protein YhgE